MENKKIRGKINSLLSQKKRLLTYATALSLTAAALTGCSEEQLFNDSSIEQRNDIQDNQATEKTFSYDEIANSYYVSIYNAKEEKYEPYFCEEKKYILEEGDSWLESEEERSLIVDIDTQKEIAFGFDPTDSRGNTVEGIDTNTPETTDYINGEYIHNTIVSACHENSNGKCLDPERRLAGVGSVQLYHHLGSDYEFDHENNEHYTRIYIFGKVKNLMDEEDKRNSYTKKEYKELKKTIVKKWHTE
ncbi:MAG: hypothetical protein HFJ12_05320 [Bacilli bacterium]|nr:hypothetical protein [Bacilli bacterium]